jgi:hypothetical protein
VRFVLRVCHGRSANLPWLTGRQHSDWPWRSAGTYRIRRNASELLSVSFHAKRFNLSRLPKSMGAGWIMPAIMAGLVPGYSQTDFITISHLGLPQNTLPFRLLWEPGLIVGFRSTPRPCFAELMMCL